MALFKILQGDSSRLNSVELHDGFAYFTPDDGNFYIDAIVDGTLKRIQLNAARAKYNHEGQPLEDAYLNTNGDTASGLLKYSSTEVYPVDPVDIVHKQYVDTQDTTLSDTLLDEIDYITPKISSITTSTGTAWVQEGAFYSQIINSIPNIIINKNTKIDLLTTGSILKIMQDNDIMALWVENNNGSISLKSFADNNNYLSTNALTIPVLCSQVQKV